MKKTNPISKTKKTKKRETKTIPEPVGKSFRIKHEKGSYYTGLTVIGPAFDGTKETAKSFTSRFAVSLEMNHWAFAACSVEHVSKPLSPSDEKYFREFIHILRDHEPLNINHQSVLDLFASLDQARADLFLRPNSNPVQLYVALTGLKSSKKDLEVAGVGTSREHARHAAKMKGFVTSKWRQVSVEPINFTELLRITNGEKSWSKVSGE